MTYRTIFRPEAREELRKLPRTVAMSVFRKLTELEADPLGFGTTALVGSPEVRRLRVGDYRVIYTVEHDRLIVWVVHVGHRSGVYD
ncbi:type II toxin-antitoxin system RelE family toxin [Nocardiopsis changdeensis]|uniref:Type II toxin-antitoxin system RelE/ParE family toxin n=1 Tax=Nocardiopsis changdeensis TaxID=2831969 RepID=A0ABX8BK99_9ACTN|nr:MULTISPECIES: type II toxin-antitoxin system RelE/ParE family toxin [Nocardiopsis]QUX22526.1 type II toxin-antitoxin system RelE/ParE family toxin [Nocardiopsis changdeensis]QYX38467.1 type II toxin-antitoxin system RelE/ParE family toxin [Nocardiopsis sp. MT53]